MTKPKFKILSIDGGGIRGIIPCYILKYIESQIGGNLADTFDLIVGTSTGGIITLGLSTNKPNAEDPYTAEEMLELYKDKGKLIFEKRKKDFLSRLLPWFKLGRQLSAKPYDTTNLENLLQAYFGERKLSEARTNVVVTTYDIESSRPFYFVSRLAKTSAKENFFLREIARSTSAAPTYFAPNVITNQDNEALSFIDGGVFANNPSVLAYAEAKELLKQRRSKAFEPVVAPDDDDLPFYLLSIGTGKSTVNISGLESSNWRTFKWLEPMLSRIFMQSVTENTHYAIQHLLPPFKDGTPRYQRFNVDLTAEMAEMDDASPENITALCTAADEFVQANKAALHEVCDLLK